MSGSSNTAADREFARRAATYLREQGLTDDEVKSALVAELGFRSPEAEELIAASNAA